LISNVKTVAAKTVAALLAIAALGLCLVSMVSAETVRQHLSAFTAGTSNAALATDTSGNVYVVDPSESAIHRFDQAGNPVAFSALSGSNTINGSDAGPDPDKTPQNGFSLDPSSQVVVDTTGGATEGQIYVASPGQNVVDVFNPDGSYLTQITGTATPTGSFSYSCGLALDGDTLYVANSFSGEIDRYVRSGNPIVEGDFDDAITGLATFTMCGLAVDSGGNVYNANNAFGSAGAVTKYAPSDFGTTSPTGTSVTGAATAIAVNPADDDLFADTGTSVLEFDSSGAAAGPEFGSPFLTDSHGVLPVSSGNVLVSNNGDTPQIHTFGPAVDLPVVTTGTATNVAANTATLNGTVDPDSLSLTDCSFQYVDDAQFGIDGFASATSAPCVPAVPAGADPVPVSADISGLSPDTTYHFRLTASTADGTATGDANTFFFRTPVDPDAVALPAAGVTETSAVIGGLVDPNNFPTTYYIEYADNPAFTGSTSLPPTQDADAGDGDTPVSVSAVASGLTPDTDYFFRVVVNSTAGDDTSDVITFHTLGTEPPPPVCPNAQFRTGPSAHLPDCRVYEKVSPDDKDGSDILNGLDAAATDGERVTYNSFGAFGGAQGGGLVNQFLSQRTATGWSLDAMTPLQIPTPSLAASIWSDFSPDLTTSAFSFLAGDPGFDGAAPNTANIYRRHSDGTLDLISSGQQSAPAGVGFPPATNYDGGSDDLSVIAFDLASDTPVTVTSGPQGPLNVSNLYRGDGNSLVLVSILPGGTPAPEGGAIGGGFSKFNAVSNDGSRIYWSLPPFGSTPPEVYLRSGGATTWVSESQRTTPDPDGVQAKNYQYATPDGAQVFFTSGEKLTDDSVATGANPDLYRYDVSSGDLTDITTQDAAGAGVQGVLGISDSGGRVYFSATGNLAAGATPGTPNLYVSEGTTTTFIATLDQFSDSENWGSDFNSKTARVSPDGSFLLFSSIHQQTSYNNGGFREFYRYDLSDGTTQCVSCNPSGAPATASAASFGSADSLNLSGMPLRERRNMLPDGSAVFFVSQDRLVPEDTNGKFDVYMWRADGRLKLITSGHSINNSQFVDASADGQDIFFLTRERLVGVDRDNDVDIYDARDNGGLADQNPNQPVPCQGDDCKPPANNPPPGGNPGTSGVNGNGNVQGGSAADCSALDAQANSLAKKSKQLLAKAKKSSGKQKANLQKKAKKTKKKANKARAQANQCKGQS
jgi:hypothetical protein